MKTNSSGAENHILRELPPDEYACIQPLLSRAQVWRGEVLLEPGHATSHLLFPVTAVVSLVQRYHNGQQIEVAAVGCEGIVCLASSLAGHTRSQLGLRVQISGRAFRISTADFERCMLDLAVFSKLVTKHFAVLLGEAYLSVACNRLHDVSHRLARVLLLSLDRSRNATLPLTHELLADMLGVTRQSVSVAANEFVQAGLISYRRGVLQILDRERLEHSACECYRLRTQHRSGTC
jgi:CRP-like cAMP-binding protein